MRKYFIVFYPFVKIVFYPFVKIEPGSKWYSNVSGHFAM